MPTLRLLPWLLLAGVCAQAGTVAYWTFDQRVDGAFPAAVGGSAFAWQSAGSGDDVRVAAEPALAEIPNPDRTPGFIGDATRDQAALACPGNPVENRYLATGPGTNVLRLHGTAWTCEAWIRFTGDAPDGYGDIILATRDNPDFCGLNLMVLRPGYAGAAMSLACQFEVKETADVPHASFMVRTAPVIETGHWYHIALVWDAPKASLFVNGMRAAMAQAPAEFDTRSADERTIDCLHLGGREAASKNSFAGEIDELRISDQALPPTGFLMFPASGRPLRPACQVAVARHLPPTAPKAADVLMRALRWRPINAKDSQSTMQAMDDFHVTGLVWAYIHDPAVIAQVKESGRFFQGAVTSSLQTMRSLLGESAANDAPDVPGFIDRYTTKNLDGTPNEQPWKRYWTNDLSRVSGCCSNPEFETLYVRALMTYIEAGTTMIQRDEGAGNSERPAWGACFCPWCVQGFRAYLKETLTADQLQGLGIADIDSFDYAARLRAAGAPSGDDFRLWNDPLKPHFVAYQAQASIHFFQRTRRALEQRAGFPVPMSCNNGVRVFDEVMQQFDWFFGELSYQEATLVDLYRLLKQAESFDRLQIVTMPKKGGHVTYPDPDGWERHTRQTIAMAYASGHICMVPWDVYMPDTFDENRQRSMTPRYFGTAAQYADLFGFIRANATWLEGYEDAAAIGPGLLETRWGLQPPLAIVGEPEAVAIVRAKPGGPDAPVVIHLVDWREKPEPLRITLCDAALFPGKSLTASLLVPPAFAPQAHQTAEATRDYAALSQTVPLVMEGDEEGMTEVQLPALAPWGMLVVRPAP